MAAPQAMLKAHVEEILRQVGTPSETIREILESLPDLIDFDQCANVLQKYGITRDQLVSQMGGSP
jgi:hypothetical protein